MPYSRHYQAVKVFTYGGAIARASAYNCLLRNLGLLFSMVQALMPITLRTTSSLRCWAIELSFQLAIQLTPFVAVKPQLLSICIERCHRSNEIVQYSVQTQTDGECVVRNKAGKLISKHGDSLRLALRPVAKLNKKLLTRKSK